MIANNDYRMYNYIFATNVEYSSITAQQITINFINDHQTEINDKIKKKNSEVAMRVGFVYKCKKIYDMMKHYYSIAIGLNNSHAMYSLALYYSEIEKSTYFSNIYFKLGAKMNHIGCIASLGPIKSYCCGADRNIIALYDTDGAINKFLNNSVKEICHSCYIETLCIDNNNYYYCGECM